MYCFLWLHDRLTRKQETLWSFRHKIKAKLGEDDKLAENRKQQAEMSPLRLFAHPHKKKKKIDELWNIVSQSFPSRNDTPSQLSLGRPIVFSAVVGGVRHNVLEFLIYAISRRSESFYLTTRTTTTSKTTVRTTRVGCQQQWEKLCFSRRGSRKALRNVPPVM